MNSAIFLWGKKLVVLILSAVILLLILGYGYQTISEIEERKAFPADGQLVWVNNTTYHIHCIGVGSPTVILEQGLGHAAIFWRDMHEQLGKVTRTCAYDRAGLGFSEPLAKPLSAPEVAQHLNDLLIKVGIDDELILAGWSAGGVYVRSYYQQFPENVKGMVLIDSSHEQQSLQLPMFMPSDWDIKLDSFKWMFGIHRLNDYIEPMLEMNFENVPATPSTLTKIRAVYNTVSQNISATNEYLMFEQDTIQKSGPESLGDIPLTVISAGLSYAQSDEERAEDVLFEEMQLELSKLSSKGKRIIAHESGHGIPFEQPAIIVDSITEMVATLRGKN